MLKSFIITSFFLLFGVALYAQSLSIRGRVTDANDKSKINLASVVIFKTTDTLNKQRTLTDSAGRFKFAGLQKSNYILKVNYIGYKPLIVKVAVDTQNINLGALKLAIIDDKEVKVVGHQIRAEVIGDTVQYHADAFKTNPDATTEDLITKMPGITVTNGNVQAHGEDVKQVLVDGKPFFGDDPTTALRNLPAEVVDKVQVYDKLSDQSAFTGFDDGNSQKTINIITKKNRQNGQFGRAVVGYGTDNTYQASGVYNIFNNNQRISIVGLSNNINQQNFSTQDLLGVMGSGSQRGGSGRMGASIGKGSSSLGSIGGASNNFLVGQQGGINTTNSAGINYSDSLGKNLYVTGSYFFNNANNTTTSTLARTYFTSQNINPLYNEADQSTSKNYNHRANVRMEYKIDTLNSLVFTPKFTYQNTTQSSAMQGVSRLSPFDTSSTTDNKYGLNSSGYDINANLLWRHKFAKAGRTLSLNIGTDINEKNATSDLNSTNIYKDRNDSTALISQHATAPTKTSNFNASLSYTEPVSKNGQIQINYNPSYTQSNVDQRTFIQNGPGGEYVILDSTLSNSYNYTTLTNKGGLSYRVRIGTVNMSVGVNFQNSQLNGTEALPLTFASNKPYSFNSILPTVMFSERFENKSNIRIIYNTSAGLPSLSQLQNVVNNTNPLLLSAGNPNLDQSYTNSLVVRYGKTNTTKAHSFFAFASVSHTGGYIGNSTIIAYKDTIVPLGNNGYNYRLPKGAQLSLPVNLSDYWNARAFATFGLPMDFVKSNLNFNAGVSYSSTPGLLNNALNYAHTYALNPGLVFSSNISEKVDFTLNYSSSYNIVNNTLNVQANNNYFTHTAGFKFNWIFWKGFTFSTDISHTLYTGLNKAYDQSLLLVNGGIGKKLFKDQSGEIKLIVFDLLNQNSSVTPTVTDTYIDDLRTQVLQRYFMLSFSYNLKKFKS